MAHGSGAKTLAFLLNNYCNVSIEKIQELISDVTGGAIQLSTGMINGLSKTFSVKTEKERAEIFATLLYSPVMYSDATVMVRTRLLLSIQMTMKYHIHLKTTKGIEN